MCTPPDSTPSQREQARLPWWNGRETMPELEELPSVVDPRCDECGGVAVKRCIQCDGFFCDTCFKVVRRTCTTVFNCLFNLSLSLFISHTHSLSPSLPPSLSLYLFLSLPLSPSLRCMLQLIFSGSTGVYQPTRLAPPFPRAPSTRQTLLPTTAAPTEWLSAQTAS